MINNKFKICILFSLIALNYAYAQQKPNVVVFIADDVGMELGCYGFKGAKTPNIDHLADNGLKCTNAFLTTSSCSPSRTSLLSGYFAHTIGTEDLHTPTNDTTRLLPSYLKEKGYFTGIMLKGHIGEKYGMSQFDWYDNGFYPDWLKDGTWNNKALGNFQSFLNKAGGKPFFLWLGFVDAHRPFNSAESVPGNGAPEIIKPSDVSVPPYLVDDIETRTDLAHYYDEVSRMDQHIGRMVKELENRGVLENTLIVFISDNGKPFPRAKGTCYDSGIKTPYIFYWKGVIQPSSVYDSLISTLNLAPTILDLAGFEDNQGLFAKSMKPIFFDQSLSGDKYIYAERNWHEADEHIRAIRSEDYLLILNSYTWLPHGSPSDLSTSPSWYALTDCLEKGEISSAQKWLFNSPRNSIELYNVKDDPYQINNLSGKKEYLEKSNELTMELVNWMIKTGDHPSNKRRKADVIDRISGFPIKGSRDFFNSEF